MPRSTLSVPRSKVALAILMPLAILALLEGVCRFAGVARIELQRPFKNFSLGWEWVAPEEPPYFVAHPTRFFEPAHDARGVARTDEHGFRGPDHPAPHPHLVRVAILGDSTAFGYGARYGQCFAGALASALRERFPATDVDVVDAGCYAYSSWQNRLDLDDRVLPMHPDVVVLCLSGFNDAVGALGFDDETWTRFAPATKGPLGTLRRESRLYAAIERAAGKWKDRAVLGDPEEAARRVIAGDVSSGRRVPVASFRANVRAMLARVRAAGAEPLLMLHRHPAAELASSPERGEYSDALLAIAGETKTPLFDGGTALDPADASLYFDKIHPTEEGHARLARGLLAALLERTSLAALAQQRRAEPRPALASCEPGAAYATGGATLALRGDFAGDPAPRFFAGGDPLERLDCAGGIAHVALPPLMPGHPSLEVATIHGSARLDGALAIDGPTLELARDGRQARVVVRGAPREHFQLLVSLGRKERTRMLGRSYGLDDSAKVGEPLEGDLDANGVAALAVPLPAGSFPELFAQALLIPPPVAPAPGALRIILPTPVASIGP